ncbi:MAG TPA: tyrosine-type recombinase/integrase [Acidimicrobiales bacterium]|nr:tyrosine-type recombinase/integrase [Acidimicrobiales bacterium]
MVTEGAEPAQPTNHSGHEPTGWASFRAERAMSPVDGSGQWVVLDAELVVHVEASDFCRALYGASRSPHTIRAYAGRVALFLSWCQVHGFDWKTIGLPSLARFKHWLEATPIDTGRVRRGGTVDAILIAVCEFLRFCARTAVIDQAVADRLSEPRWLRFLPAGFDAGERGQFRTVRVREIKARTETPFPEALTPEQSETLFACCRRPRERFMVRLLHDTGLRIGEALGLRREDMHLLPDSRRAGCAVVGPHVHVRHRANPNGALAKSRFPRMVPASEAVLLAYADYQFERGEILGADDDDMVFVNLYHQPFGTPMTYRAAKGFFERLARQCGFPARPHMLRHTAATNWVRAGVELDVVQRLLGHASPASSLVYLHARDGDKRRAVEAVAAGERYR